MEFVAPLPKKYMGSKDKESLLYNGERDHCPNTLDPVFKTVGIPDLNTFLIFLYYLVNIKNCGLGLWYTAFVMVEISGSRCSST